METYLFDTHVHTSESSYCGVMSAEETVRQYHAAGFSGLCITDHYCASYGYTKINEVLKGYRRALKCGRKLGMDILLGVELRLPGSLNDYLLFGVTESFLRNNPGLLELNPAEAYKLLHKNDILVFQAHPFRTMCSPADPRFLDGIEIANGNPRHNSHNDKAADYARKHKLFASAGSDCHQIEDVAALGIRTTQRIRSMDMLKEVLVQNAFEVYEGK